MTQGILKKMNDDFFIRVKKLTVLLSLAVGLGVGYICGSYIQVNSDGRNVKAPNWSPIATEKYKGYEFTHIDFYQPQYINTIIDKEMLVLVNADIKRGLISVANPSLGINIGDAIKYTADNKIWLLISAKDSTHRFKAIDNKGEK